MSLDEGERSAGGPSIAKNTSLVIGVTEDIEGV